MVTCLNICTEPYRANVTLDVAMKGLSRRMSQPSVVMERIMTAMQWIAGSSVIAAAVVCGLISSEIVNSNIPTERTAAVNSNIPAERTVVRQHQTENAGKTHLFHFGRQAI